MLQVNGLRAEVIRDLAKHPEGSTTTDIGERLGCDYRTVYQHIKVLRQLDLLTAAGQGLDQRRGPLYQMDTEKLTSLVFDSLGYLLGN